ncbi:lysosomal-trafficking regulator-like isoform X2 [Gigantopelta aegis]|uniref:lysosomal-trafficking regulator-like isoform X2 n=1 Tax=Gigantopelta aegis TaxID=1735272 RepID=UPI001B887BB9|nr:lysosomal-trafficking regulator-like isoform X2 [Gigantopelta aegis]
MHELLLEIWDSYAHLVRRKTDKYSKRYAVLDKFLKLYLMLADGSDGAPNLGNMKNVCSQLCQELMNDILFISNNTRDKSDASGLEEYLLQGRGWMLLKVIHHVGMKSLSNCRDLCNLLLSLLPWCETFQSVEADKMSIYNSSSREPVASCFKTVQKLSKLKTFSSNDEQQQRHYGFHEEHIAHRKKVLKKVSGYNAQQSDSDDSAGNTKPRHRHLRLKRGPRINVYKLSVRLDDKESDSDTDLVDTFPNMDEFKGSISSADLCHVILLLLQDLCVLDLDNAAPGKLMSSVILPHLLHLLSTISSSNVGPEKFVWSRETVMIVQKQLVYLLFTVGSIIATQQNGVKILLAHNIVAALLKSVSHHVKPQPVEEGAEKGDGDSEKLTDVERQFVLDTLCGITLLLEVIFQQLPFMNPSFINNALCILEEFKENGGFDFVKVLLTEMESINSKAGQSGVATNGELLKHISSFILTLKLVKVNYIHFMKCLKRRHRNCDYGPYLHHHHDILGLSWSSNIQQGLGRMEGRTTSYTQSRCLVARWVTFVLDLLGSVKCKKLQVQLLSMLHSPGICCCMQPKMLIESLMPLVPTFSVSIRDFCLEILSDVLLEQFLGKEELFESETSETTSNMESAANACQQCLLEGELSSFSKMGCSESIKDLAKGKDSGFSSVDIQDQRKQKSLKRWQALQFLKSHIVTPDEGLALCTAKHLMVLAIRGNSDIKEQLFFRIYQPILHWPVDKLVSSLSSLTDTSSDDQAFKVSISSSVLMYCVSALPYVLQVDIVMNAFLEKHGLSRLANLMEDEHLRAPVMGVFEALIMIDEQKVQEQKRKLEPNLSKFTSDYIRGTVMQMFTESLAKKTCAIMANFQQLSSCSHKAEEKITPTDVVDDSPVSGQRPICVFQHHHSIVKNLPVLLDMWETSAKLCMNSLTFRSYFRNSPCLYIVQDTLLLVLEILSGMGSLTTVGCCEMSDGREKISFSCHFRQLAFIEAVMVVCFSCSTISPIQKKGSEEQHWCQLLASLQRCINLEPCKLKAVFEMLLSAAQPQLSSILEYSYNQIIAMLNLQDSDDDVDEDDVHYMCDVSPSDRDDDTVYTEHGYEADTEISLPTDWKKDVHLKQKKRKQLNTRCFPAIFRLFVELAVSSKKTQSGQTIMIPILLRFLQLLHNSPLAVQAVCSEGVLQVMLEGFRENLTDDAQDSHEVAVQEILLLIFQLLSQKELSATELGLFMKFFLSKHSPCTKGYLLSSLMNVVEHIQVEPAYTLTFPVPKKHPPKPKDTTGTEKMSQLCCCPKRTWGQSAIHCFISSGLPWPPFPTGFSAVFWMNIDEVFKQSQVPPSNSSQRYSSSLIFSSLNTGVDVKVTGAQKNGGTSSVPILYPVGECLHVMSLGKTDKTFEVWVDVARKRFIFRITSTTNEDEILKEVCSDRLLFPGKWQHVVFSYEESLNGSTLIGKLKILIDSWVSREITLDYPAQFHRKLLETPPTLCVGHVEDLYISDAGQYHLGNVMLFKGVDFSREWWFHHFCLGPDLSSVSKCDCADLRTVYTPHLTREILCQSGLTTDVLVGALPVADVEKARISAVLSYQPKFAESALHLNYNHHAEMVSSQNIGSAIMPYALIYQLPETLTPFVSGQLMAQKHSTMEKAVEQIGGVGTFLFLVAKVYEECIHILNVDRATAESLQSTSVRLLFAAVHHMPLLAAEFIDMSGYAMLSKVMVRSRSVMGFEVLKALLNSCTSESVFRPDASATKPVLRLGTEAVVRDISIVEHLLLSWRLWDEAEEDVVELLFLVLKVLVREDHPYRSVNVKQYKAGNILMKIFSIYLERIQEALPLLSTDVSQSVTSIVASLLGSPPDLHLLVNVTDFLLLVHPAASAYVNHADSYLFFKPWWAFPSATSTPVKLPTASSSTEGIQSSARKGESSPVQRERVRKSMSDEERLVEILDKNLSDETSHESDGKSRSSQLEKTGSLKLSTKSNTDEKQSLGSDASSVCGSEFPPLQYSTSEYTSALVQSDSEYNSSSKKSPQTNIPSTDNENSTDSGMFTQKKNAATVHHFKSSSKGEISDDDEDIKVELAEDSDGTKTSSCRLPLVFTVSQDISEVTVVNFDSVEDTGSEKDIGLATLLAGLLNYIHWVILDIPDHSLDVAFGSVLDPGCLIILAHNSSPQIRATIIRLIGAYVSRAPHYYLEMFLKIEGFHLLSNQLHQYPASEEHLEDAVSIFLGQDFSFNDGCQLECLTELTAIQQSSPVLFLSLLEKTAHDVALCHNSLEGLCQLMENSPILTTLFIEQGLPEVLCNLIATVHRDSNRPTDISGRDESQLILQDIQKVLCILAENEFSWSGVGHYQQLEDLINLMKALENHQSLFDCGQKHAETVRALQYTVISKVLDYVETQSKELSQQTLSWFTLSDNNPTTGRYSNQKRSPSTPRFSQHHHNPSLTETYPSSLPHKKAGMFFRSDKFSDIPFDEKMLSSVEMDGSSGSFTRWSLSRSSSQQGLVASPPSTSRLSFLFGKNKKVMHTPISQSELLDRFKKFLVFAVDLVVFKERTEVIKPVKGKSQLFFSKTSNNDDNFLTKLFTFTYRALECTLDKSGYNRKTGNVIMWGAKDLIRQQFGRLLLCMLSTRVDFNVRLFALSFIMGEMRGREIIKMCASVHPMAVELGYYVFDLLTTWRDWLVGPQREQGCGLLNILRQLGHTIFMTEQKLTAEKIAVLTEDKRNIDSRFMKEKHLWRQKKETVTYRILHRFDKHAKLIAEQAMAVTRNVTRLQNAQRKKLIEHIKKNMTEQIQLKQSWQRLVQNLTHERSVWYHEESYPRSWQMDPTEGPGRTRRRLQRSHLELDAKYLTDDYKKNVDSQSADPPLIFLFQDKHQMSDAAALIYRLQTNEKIQYTSRCTAVSPSSESKGELLVGEMSIFFVADEAITDANYTQVLLGNKDQLSMKWPHVDIREIHQRRYQLLDVGLEIFLTNGKTCLLAFPSSHERNALQTVLLKSLELPNLIASGDLAAVQRLWQEGKITNYDYLTYLNKMAGRSFNDLMQYPVFPFILRDYLNVELNLNNPAVYRDLSKPIAVQEKLREQKYRDNYEFLRQEYEKPPDLDNSIRIKPYHYGSHYSNSGTVLHYLVRLPPFTKMFLSYQDASFDIPDRTFHSMATSWRLSSFESASDVKELIPEFFFLPEFFVNSEGFNFGKRQNGEVVSDVILPPWSLNDARLFILIHRQALESAYVTQNIHHWINLVFGYKQQGEEAFKAINVFHPSTYFGIDVELYQDPVKRQAVLTMIRTYGQTPIQLFYSPHPPSQAGHKLSSGLSRTPLVSEKKVCVPRLKNITGLNWGNYMWNPEGAAPEPAWQQKYSVVFKSLVPIPTGYMFGLEDNACVLLLHGKDKADVQENVTDVMWAGIVSWGYQDGILRVQNKVAQPPINFLREPSCDEIMCCASVPDCRLFFTAGTAGVINVYNVAHNSAKASNLQVFGSLTALIGHTGTVNVMVLSKPFSVIVTGSEDGTIIVWDLNRLSYVLSITSHPKAVKTLAVSDTLGDLVSVSPRALGSFIQLHTINGKHVVSRKCDEFSINCLAYSTAPEGRSINVIAGGLSTGVIRLWNSWDLSCLLDLEHESSLARPVVSVAFTYDCQRLFASAEDGTVTMWEKPSTRGKPHNFSPFIQPRS